ncbi:MAG: insulinase family protein [Bacteroidales bacterium]|nr:insulinase family protein [Bacteroidales bacterium]
MINIPATETLMPREVALGGGRTLKVFGGSTDLVKLDFLYEAGSIYQPQLLCATAANKLMTMATESMTAADLSEFMDFRGVILENSNTLTHSGLTVYMLRRYADEVLPVVAEILKHPAMGEDDYRLWQVNRKQELATMEQRTPNMARRLFNQSIFGAQHPLGWHADVADVDRLALATVKEYFHGRYDGGPCGIVAAGKVDDGLVGLIDRYFDAMSTPEAKAVEMDGVTVGGRHELKMEGAVQTTLRVGRLLPLRWDDLDYARFTLLVAALGGYFGSRLMTNLREDKGYTYGAYARTQIYRGAIVFYLTADVAGGTANAALGEALGELKRLCDEPMDEEELQLVKTVMVGDFLRSVDGVFELSTRCCDMQGTSIDERFTDNLRTAIKETTAVQLQELAQRLLKSEDMTICLAGV